MTHTIDAIVATVPTAAELDEYKAMIEKCLALKIDTDISNGIPAHAAIIFAAFFANAKQKVRIYAKNLSADVFGSQDVVKAAQNAFERGCIIDILIEEDQPERSAFVNFIASHASDRLSLRRAPVIDAGDTGMNFSSMDDRAYRFEENNSKVKAVANMYSLEFTRAINAVFDKMKRISTDVSLADHYGVAY